MSNPQLAEIDESLKEIVRRAYDLGRGDALKKVVDVLNEDRPGSERLALMAPDELTLGGTDGHRLNGAPAMDNAEATSAAPWWAWPVR